MKTLSIIIGKIVLYLCKLLGRGSALPGKIVYKINKKILRQLEKPKTVICVTGSSGKGSTSSIIADVYKKIGHKVAYNDKGSNELSAVITTLLENSSLTGKSKVDVGVFETDERYTKYIYPDLKPNYVIVTNITRDQPPRQRNYDFVLEEIKKALNKDIHLILNADDPYLRKLNLEDESKVTYYSVEQQEYSYKENKFNPLNIYRCPKCMHKLNYNYYNFEYLGDYSCPNCDFKKPDSSYKVTNINYKTHTITINEKYDIKLNNDMLFNVYNTLAAFSALSINNLDKEKIAQEISKINKDTKIYNNYRYKNRNVFVLNNKNENATTFNQSVLYTERSKKLKTIVIGWWQISRRYDFDDLSWLYDIEFEILNKQNIDKIICAGPQKYAIAERLKYAGIDEKKLKIFNDLYEAEKTIKSSKGDIYAILNFDYLKPFNKIMEVK